MVVIFALALMAMPAKTAGLKSLTTRKLNAATLPETIISVISTA
jgi:hypothetical protein